MRILISIFVMLISCGQEKTTVIQTKYEDNSFNLFGGGTDFEDLISRDNSYKWQTTEFRDEVPLLESESRLPDGENAVEGSNADYNYADGKAYIINADGGPYADLVKAAEKCTARVIHPGTPKDRTEKDIEKWIKRGEKYN